MEENQIATSSADHHLLGHTENNCYFDKCIEDDKENMFQCSSCHRYVHYQCSLLPPYHAQLFLTNKRLGKHFCCNNCVEISKNLICHFKTKENQETKIKRLERDIAACNNIIKLQQEREATLTQAVELLKSKVHKLKEKSIDRHTVTYLEEKVHQKMEEIGTNLKDSILKEMNDKVIQNVKSYAEATKPSSTTNDLKTIVHEARNEELIEANNRKARANSIIIHGIQETNSDDAENKDQTFVNSLINVVKARVDVKQSLRIGTFDTEKNRPLKVAFKNESQKSSFMSNLSALKNIAEYKKISITEDLTQAERSLFKEWSTKAREKNDSEPVESNVVWRVRGSSKNGWRLMKFNKKDQRQQ